MTRDEMIEVMARAIEARSWDKSQLTNNTIAANRRRNSIRQVINAISALEAAGYVVVPSDDVTRPLSDSALPPQMIEAGMDALEKARDDMERNYVPGETIDWDDGMVAVAVYRAMLSAAQQEKTDAS